MINILIVDDDANKAKRINDVVLDSLSSQEEPVCTAQTITDAAEMLKKKNFDLMILDLNLPMRHGTLPSPDAGVKFLEHVQRKTELLTPTHIIGLTAFDNLLDEHESIFKGQVLSLVQYDQTTNAWEDVIRHKVFHVLNTQSLPRSSRPSSYSLSQYGVIALIAVIVLTIVAVFLPWHLTLVVIAGAILFLFAIGVLQLRNDHKLDSKGFTEICLACLKIIPEFMKPKTWFSKKGDSEE